MSKTLGGMEFTGWRLKRQESNCKTLRGSYGGGYPFGVNR
jgi:hypothetical protein